MKPKPNFNRKGDAIKCANELAADYTDVDWVVLHERTEIEMYRT